MHRLLRSLLAMGAAAVAFPFADPAGAQQGDATQAAQRPAGAQARPVTGLVLSGGGALGLAHLGVLKVLAEEGVPVDRIAGTSMGALVGGGYAAGHTPQELASIVRSADWGVLFAGRAPRAELAWRRKQDDLLVGRLEFGVSSRGIALPSGAIGGQTLQLYFRDIARPVREVRDLDLLPIPFRAVATDLVSGREVVLKDVPLELAMRASMSVPGAFTPVELGAALLVDGGLLNNLPVDVARAMGSQRLIVVRVGSTMQPREALGSGLGIAQQIASIMVEGNERRSLATLGPDDLLIEIDTTGFTSADFDRAAALIERGEAAARAVLAGLRRYAVPAPQYAEFERRRVGPVRMERPPVLAEVEIEGLRSAAAAVLAREMALPLGAAADEARIRAAVAGLFARDDFERVDYRFEPLPPDADGSARERLVVVPIEKRWGPRYLRLGGRVESNLSDQNRFDLAAAFTWTWLNTWGAEWQTRAQIGTERRLETELYQPLGPGSRWYVLPQLASLREEFEIFEGERAIARFENIRRSATLRFGHTLQRLGTAYAGGGVTQVETSQLIGPLQQTAGPQRSSDPLWFVGVRTDTLDSVDWPRSGHRLLAEYQRFEARVGSAGRSDQWLLAGQQAVTFGRGTLVLFAEYGQSVQQGAFRLGGFARLSGTPFGQIVGSKLLFASAVGYRNVSDWLGIAGPPVYAGLSLEAGNAVAEGESLRPSGLHRAGMLFVGADTLIGPVYFGYGGTRDGATSFYLIWGRLR
jgi:NTE family protein